MDSVQSDPRVVFSVADVSLSSADSRDRRFSADALASSSPL